MGIKSFQVSGIEIVHPPSTSLTIIRDKSLIRISRSLDMVSNDPIEAVPKGPLSENIPGVSINPPYYRFNLTLDQDWIPAPSVLWAHL